MKETMDESVLRRYVRRLLKEDPMGFVHDLAASDKFRYDPRVRGAQVGKAAGRDIKRAFNKNADHQFLSTLDTVHWAYNVGFLERLKGGGKDELSTTMTLPGDSFKQPGRLPYGLWIKGRITLASNEQDDIYSGFYGDYGVGPEGDEEAIAQRDRSSGRNKRPTRSKDYRKFSAAKKGNPAHEKVVRREIPYVLDQSTWDPSKTTSTNEALVDNWRPIGIIVVKADVADAILKTAKKLAGEGGTPPSGKIVKDIDYFSVGVVKAIMLASLDLDVPIYDADRNVLWSPKQSRGDLAEDKKRKPRKKGQHKGSPSHSDLYTDENPKGTIKGLKFATIKDAEASVNKIKGSGKSHAHKVQAAVAMEQRAKAAGKKSAAGVYRGYINSVKKESIVREYIAQLIGDKKY